MITLIQILFTSLSVHAANFDFYPSATINKAPTLIFVHGGAWISGSTAQYQSLATAIASRGLCLAVAEYSLAPKVRHPTPVDELQKVIEAVALLKKDKCDLTKIFLIGHSAGAHMIAFWNTKYSHPSVKGFIGVEGIYNLVKLSAVWPTYKNWFLTSAFGPEKTWSDASPALLKTKSQAPWLLVHSSADELVDTNQTTDFASHLKTQNITATLVLLKKENHAGAIESLANKDSTLSKALAVFIK